MTKIVYNKCTIKTLGDAMVSTGVLKSEERAAADTALTSLT